MTDQNADQSEPIGLSKLSKAEHVVALREEIMQRRGRPVRIDGKGVSLLSGLAAQVLLATERTWKIDGQPFEIIEPSDELGRDLNLLGLSYLIESGEKQCL